MDASTRTLHELLSRHLMAIAVAYKVWVKEQLAKRDPPIELPAPATANGSGGKALE